MLLSKLLANLNILNKNIKNNHDIGSVAYDSRCVGPGGLFVAIKGFQTDGHQYIKKALENKAQVILIDDESYMSKDYEWVLVDDTRLALSVIANNLYDSPSKNFKLIGVTGTNGKTTTTNVLAKLLEMQGKKVGLIGTIENRIGNKIYPVERTTPEALELQELFYKMSEEKVDFVIMEVSSHALDLGRVSGSFFDLVVFTNLSQDHLDFHENMEDYFQAKMKLFKSDRSKAEKAVVNIDDPWGEKILKITDLKVQTYSIEKNSDFRAEDTRVDLESSSYILSGKKVETNLVGNFNIYNSLAALLSLRELGLDLDLAIENLKEISNVSGRFEMVDIAKKYSVIVDYAHTPDGLRNVLETAREITRGRLISVFGCGGDRDRKKRPIMGQVSESLADINIITSDNPRTEKPEEIINDILAGLKNVESNTYIEADRRKAIKKAMEIARDGDCILIAGKGHETYQEINGIKHHFNDIEIVKEFA